MSQAARAMTSVGCRDAVINGDLPLSACDARAYYRHARREIQEAREPAGVLQAPAGPVRRDDTRSPFRIYAETVLQQAIGRFVQSTATILDIGCGQGRYARLFRHCSGTYIGVDVRQHPDWSAMVATHGTSSLEVRFVQASAEDLDRLDVRASFSFSSSMLEHVSDPRGTMRALALATEPGSYTIHIVPAPWSILGYGHHGWRRFSAVALRDLLVECGFEVVDLSRLGGTPSLVLQTTWICGLETGWALQACTFSRLPVVCYHVARRIRVRSARSSAVLGRAYRALLRRSLAADARFPGTPLGYAIVGRRPFRDR
jgi:SAM-dependent methyltransferase